MSPHGHLPWSRVIKNKAIPTQPPNTSAATARVKKITAEKGPLIWIRGMPGKEILLYLSQMSLPVSVLPKHANH